MKVEAITIENSSNKMCQVNRRLNRNQCLQALRRNIANKAIIRIRKTEKSRQFKVRWKEK